MQRIDSARSGTDVIQSAMLPLGGELFVPFSYTNTASATSHQLNAAAKGLAVGFVAPADFAIDSYSLYKNAVGTAGDLLVTLRADGLAYEPNGAFNGGSATTITMTANNAPAPYVAALKDSAGANAEAGAGFEAFEAFDNSQAADNGTRSNAAPTAIAPIYLTLDTGTGIRVNKFRLYSFNNADANVRAFPKAFTFWVSNLEAPAAQTDADWTQLTGFTATAETDPGAAGFRDYTLTNATSYRHVRLAMTDRNGANAYVAIGSMALFAASQRSAPSTSLATLGPWTSGAGAAAWTRDTNTAYQLQRGKKYWLQIMGQAGVDVSLAINRVTGTNGTEFPDFSECLFTTDTGTSWSQSVIGSALAMLCCVLNSTTNHAPKLYYGRKRHMYDYLPDVGIRTIPQAGASLALDDTGANLTAGTLYYVYAYDSSGTLTLQASTTSFVKNGGIEVKSGDTSKRFIGLVSPVARIGVNVGPIYVPDYIGVTWRGAKHKVGKRCPYVTTASQVYPSVGWAQLGTTSGDYLVYILSLQTEMVAKTGNYWLAGTPLYLCKGWFVNGVIMDNNLTMQHSSDVSAGALPELSASFISSLNSVSPAVAAGQVGNTGTISLYSGTTRGVPGNLRVSLTGWAEEAV